MLSYVKSEKEAKDRSRNLKLYYSIPKITSRSSKDVLSAYNQGMMKALDEIYYGNSHIDDKLIMLESLILTEKGKEKLFPLPKVSGKEFNESREKYALVGLALSKLESALRELEVIKGVRKVR